MVIVYKLKRILVILHPKSRIPYLVSAIWYPVSGIWHPVSNISLKFAILKYDS